MSYLIVWYKTHTYMNPLHTNKQTCESTYICCEQACEWLVVVMYIAVIVCSSRCVTCMFIWDAVGIVVSLIPLHLAQCTYYIRHNMAICVGGKNDYWLVMTLGRQTTFLVTQCTTTCTSTDQTAMFDFLSDSIIINAAQQTLSSRLIWNHFMNLPW